MRVGTITRITELKMKLKIEPSGKFYIILDEKTMMYFTCDGNNYTKGWFTEIRSQAKKFDLFWTAESVVKIFYRREKSVNKNDIHREKSGS